MERLIICSLYIWEAGNQTQIVNGYAAPVIGQKLSRKKKSDEVKIDNDNKVR